MLIEQIPREDVPAKVEGKACFDAGECDFGYDAPLEVSLGSTWEVELEEHILRASSMSVDVDPLAYWKSQAPSALQIVAIQILNTTASSAPVERIFSMCGNMCTSQRTSMSPDLLSALARAKFNGEYDLIK